MVTIRKRDIARRMRQLLREGRESRMEITLMPKRTDDASCLEASGAIRLSIRDFIPELEGSLQLPPGLEIDTGVTGNEVWPVSINDVEIEEEDEVGELTEQNLGFAQTHSEDPVRTGITVEISNMAIDSAGFDLMAYVQKKFQLAQRRYIASRLYSTANFDGNYGPFSSRHAAQWTVEGPSLYDSIIAQMTALEEAGFDTNEACIVMDFDMEKRMKFTPIVEGEGRMMIENGLCCGYNYVANKYFNTRLDNSGKLVKAEMDAIGIAVFKWFKIQQHDEARIIIDGVSKEVAERNVTSLTLTTRWSFTDLSEKINGHLSMQAFHTLFMERGYLADVGDHILTADGLALTVGVSTYPTMLMCDRKGQPLVSSDDKTFTTEIR